MEQINRFLNEQMPIQGSTVKPGLAKRGGNMDMGAGDDDVTSFHGLAKKIAGERSSNPPAMAPEPAQTDDGSSDDMTTGKTETFKAVWDRILTQGSLPNESELL